MKPADVKTSHWLSYNLHFVLEHFLGHSLYEKVLGARRKKLISRIEQHIKKTRSANPETLPFEELPSVDDFRKRPYQPVTPIVIRGGASDWVASKKWSLEFFEKQYGNKEIMVHDTEGLVDRKNPQEFETMKLGQYIELLRKGSMKYLKFSRMVHEEKTLQKDLNLGELRKFLLPLSFGEAFYMFMGAADTITPIHDGSGCTVFVNIAGRKRWIMWQTGEKIFLDVRPDRRSYFFSHADPHNLNDPEYPLLKYAKKYEVILEPGDVLWFPSWVWHQVENLTPAIGVAFKFTNLPAAWKSSALQTVLFFFATKPWLLQAYWISLFKKEDYIYTKEANKHKLEVKTAPQAATAG